MLSARRLNRSACPSRREWLRRGGAALGALLLPSATRAGDPAPRAKAAIVLFLQGGLSHYESFDPKPDAPSDVRGEFKPIATNLPGLRFCEHLPLLATRLQRFSLVRSVYHHTPDHIQAIHMTLTGSEMAGANIDTRNRNGHPALGAFVSRLRGADHADLPGYVCVPHRDQLGHRLHYASSAFLGPTFDPLDSGMLPARADLPYLIPANLFLNRGLSLGRLGDRLDLLTRLDVPATDTPAAYHRRALGLLERGAAARAFDLAHEPLPVRRRYGDHGMGQEAVLARRLAEAGVPFSLVNLALDQVKGQDWDTHEKNFELMKNTLLPPMDRAVSTLLDDLHERGLLETTLVAMLGEFGRTPRINANAGRDHWPNVYSVLLAGGGLKSGVVVGSSTRDGAEPRDRPIHLYDVLATIYHQLGISTSTMFRDPSGRQVQVMSEGKPIAELI